MNFLYVIEWLNDGCKREDIQQQSNDKLKMKRENAYKTNQIG